MKTSFTKYIIAVTAVILFLSTIVLYASEGGRTGRTLKTSTSGCGSCHGSSFTADVTVTVNGPDTVITGQTVQYSLSVTKLSKTGAGLDIAVRRGTLSPVSTNIHLASGELTHNANIPMTGGTATVFFNYIASATPGTDTIWATGLATNSDGNESGDDWNWAPRKRVVVKSPPLILNLKVLLEACSPTSDTISVPLRNVTSPYAIVDVKTGVIDNLGNVSLSYSNVSNGVNYYIVVNHWNSIETWSASGNAFTSGSLTYDFTTGLNKAYGNNMIMISGKANVFTGDVSQDGVVDGSDGSLIDNDASNFVFGYVVTDLNNDGVVDGSDAAFADNNASNFVSMIRP